MHIKPKLANGTRDFDPIKIKNRKYIFSIIVKNFKKYGFINIQTPTVENISTLNGKYGGEANKLIFKIINSGNFLLKIKKEDIKKGHRKIIKNVTKKGMIYDLTIPLMRYIVMNNNKIIFPFKRYQIQNVWRSDRVQKNRYKEFCQCDIDIVGSNLIICEIEIISIINEIFNELKIKNFEININNKKILQSISKYINESKNENLICETIDKIDKIGIKKVLQYLENKKMSLLSIKKLKNILKINENSIFFLKKYLKKYLNAIKSLNEIDEIIKNLKKIKIKNSIIKFNHKLSRGLAYYTNSIFEVKIKNNKKESLGGGGRYNNLTNIFGLNNLPSIGFSFGIDRIYNIMEQKKLFPKIKENIKVIITNTNKKLISFLIEISFKLKKNNIYSEIYLKINKLKQQLNYANKKKIKFVIITKINKKNSKYIILKNMKTGKQYEDTINNVIKTIK